MILDLLPLLAGVIFTILFFSGYYALREELSLFLRDMAHTSKTWPEVIGAADAALDASVAFPLFEITRILLESTGIRIPVVLPVLGDFLGSSTLPVLVFGFSFFGRRVKYDLMVKAFQTKSRVDDLIVSVLMLLKSAGVGVLVYYFVGWLAGLAS